MKGKFPVSLLYTTPLILSVKAPKQNTFAIELLSRIRFASCCAPYAGLWYGGGSMKTGKTGGATWGTRVGTLLMTSPFFAAALPMLFIPFFGCFMWPFAVAGLGYKYFATSSWLRLGHPWRKTLRSAFTLEDILGLHNNWCENFTAFACVCTECVKVASSPHIGVFTIGKLGCRARAIQGPAHGWVDSVACFTELDPGAVHRCPCRWIASGKMRRTH